MKIKIINDAVNSTFSILNEAGDKISENNILVQPDTDYWDHTFAAKEYLKVIPKNTTTIEIEDDGLYTIQELRRLTQA